MVLCVAVGMPIAYRSPRKRKGDWKIYDVIVENVSQVGNYRSQFNRILTIAAFDELRKNYRRRQLRREVEKQ